MKIRALQWNIQACRVLKEGADPNQGKNYTGDNPLYFASVLKKYEPDIVALQEVHSNELRDQAKEIADVLGLPYVRTDIYEEQSFMDKKYGLGQSIISKFPFVKSSYTNIFYEKFPIESPSNPGENWVSRENGMTQTEINLDGVDITIATAHLIPFSWLGLDPFAKNGPAEQVRTNFSKLVSDLKAPWLLQGDMNVSTHHLSKFLGGYSTRDGYAEVEQKEATNPSGKTLDHVVSKNIKIVSNEVDKTVLADHFLIITELEI